LTCSGIDALPSFPGASTITVFFNIQHFSDFLSYS
jgi:hypothetical protein